MLQETHPLVKAAAPEVEGRSHESIGLEWEQKFNELSMFVTAVGRLPK